MWMYTNIYLAAELEGEALGQGGADAVAPLPDECAAHGHIIHVSLHGDVQVRKGSLRAPYPHNAAVLHLNHLHFGA